MKPEITTQLILFTRDGIKQNGKYSIKLRITHNRKQRYFYTKIDCTSEEFDRLQKNPRGNLKDTKIYLEEFEHKAIDIINQMKDFDFAVFSQLFTKKENTNSKTDLFSALQERIKELEENGQIQYAGMYTWTLNSLKKFTKRKQLQYSQITPKFLKLYEKWMQEQGKSTTTTGMYLRCVRAMFNRAIQHEYIEQKLYPFSRHKYTIPAPANRKKALEIEDIKKLFEYLPETDSEGYYRDLWIFSYLCNGMNIKDIAQLQYKHLDNNTIFYSRAKTSTTTRITKLIEVHLKEITRSIIKKWGNPDEDENTYIFPILQKNLSAKDEWRKVRQVVKLINKYINRIAEKQGIDKKITTYTARHSFATIIMKSGVNTQMISQMLGHSSVTVTENYLGSFSKQEREKATDALIDF